MSTEATIVSSPRLVKDGRYSLGTRARRWLCLDELTTYIEVPKAKSYWIEASTQQWRDGSGCPVTVRITRQPSCCYREHYECAEYRDRDRQWCGLHDVLTPKLTQLGVIPGWPKTIWFRLRYEE